MKRLALISAILILVAAVAPAQMHRPPSSGNPGGGNGTMGNMGDMGPMHLAVAADGTVVAVERNVRADGTIASQTIVAYNASGVKAWTLALDGFAMGVAAAANQFYVIVVKPGTNGGSATRVLVAVSLSGTVLWSQPLG